MKSTDIISFIADGDHRVTTKPYASEAEGSTRTTPVPIDAPTTTAITRGNALARKRTGTAVTLTTAVVVTPKKRINVVIDGGREGTVELPGVAKTVKGRRWKNYYQATNNRENRCIREDSEEGPETSARKEDQRVESYGAHPFMRRGDSGT